MVGPLYDHRSDRDCPVSDVKDTHPSSSYLTEPVNSFRVETSELQSRR